MNRLLLRILFAALLTPAFIITQVNAQTPAAQPSTSIAPAKIAWINMEDAIFKTNEGKNKLKEIENFIDAKNTELDSLKKKADTLRTTLTLGGSKYKEEERIADEEKLEEMETALQRFQQDTQKDINSKRDRMTNAISKKLLLILEGIAKQKGLNAILIFNGARDAWIDQSLYITDEAIKIYNQQNAVAAPKTSAGSAPAKKEP
jgi:Skp family chaperone for outer membrane proteins